MKKLAFILGIAIAIFVSANFANATQTINDALQVTSLKVGQQGVGGVTFFNGTIVNETTDDDGNDMPVTFGDDVRIDGRLFRGATAGTSDSQPFIINDNLEVVGSLTIGSTNVVSALTALNSTTSSLQSQINAKGVGDMLKSTYDVAGNSKIDAGKIDSGISANLISNGLVSNENFDYISQMNLDNSNNRHLTALGVDAGQLVNSAGVNNTFFGYMAGDANTSGPRNLGIGSAALGMNTTGRDNIAIGMNTLDALVEGIQNVGIGNGALGATTGSYNIAIGYQAGDGITSGDNNIIIGNNKDAKYPSSDNQLNIGDIIVGNTSTKQIHGFARTYEAYVSGWTLTADESGDVHSNVNAGAEDWYLPEASNEGIYYTFIVDAAGNMDIHPDGTDQIMGLTNGAGDRIRSSTPGDTVTLIASGTDKWFVSSIYETVGGGWADIN